MVVIIGLFCCKQRHDAFLLFRVQVRKSILLRNLFTVCVHAESSSFIYWIIMCSFIQHLFVPSLQLYAVCLSLNGCLMGSVFFTCTYCLPKANILPLCIVLALIFTVVLSRMLSSPHLNNAYNLFMSQSVFKGNLFVTTVSCCLLILSFNYLNAEYFQKKSIYTHVVLLKEGAQSQDLTQLKPESSSYNIPLFLSSFVSLLCHYNYFVLFSVLQLHSVSKAIMQSSISFMCSWRIYLCFTFTFYHPLCYFRPCINVATSFRSWCTYVYQKSEFIPCPVTQQ